MRAITLIITILISIQLYCQTDTTDAPEILITEPMPTFPGGERALFKYLSDKMDFDFSNYKLSQGTKLWVEFDVDTAGILKNIKVLRGINNEIDEQAVQLIRDMPPWINKSGRLVTMRLPMQLELR